MPAASISIQPLMSGLMVCSASKSCLKARETLANSSAYGLGVAVGCGVLVGGVVLTAKVAEGGTGVGVGEGVGVCVFWAGVSTSGWELRLAEPQAVNIKLAAKISITKPNREQR